MNGDSKLEQEVKYLEKEIERLKRELKEQLETNGESIHKTLSELESYSYTVTHELKSPIREIQLYVDFIEDEYKEVLAPQLLSDLQAIRNVCSSMINLIQKLMDYARVDYKPLKNEKIYMKGLVENTFKNLLKSVPDRKIIIQIEDIPSLIGDIFLINQLVVNILSNSIKFTRNINQAKIRVYCKEENDMVAYCFEDNGVGFDMKFATNLGGLFKRVHKESDYEGNGIGLSIVKKIVERSGGIIDIFAKMNQGCQVSIKFPRDSVIYKDKNDKGIIRNNEKIRIGIIGNYCGVNKKYEYSRKLAYELAMDEINASGGIDSRIVELVFKDAGNNEAQCAQRARELVEIDNVDVIIGGFYSPLRESIRSVVDETKTLYFYDTMYEGGVADHYTFCTSLIPEHNLYPMIEYLMDNFGKKFYIITADFNYGILSAECAKSYIQKLGGEIVAIEYFQTNKNNFKITIENILEIEPCVILSFLVGDYQTIFYKQWYECGKKDVPIVSTTGIGIWYRHKVFDDPVMNNVYFMHSYLEELNTKEAMEFTKKFRSRYPEEMVKYIISETEASYTTMYLYKRAVEMAGTTETEAVIRCLESGMISFDGPGGKVIFRGEDHHVVRDSYLFKIDENNQVVPIKKYTGLHSNYIETVIEKNMGREGGLKELGIYAPNVQYNLMFYPI